MRPFIFFALLFSMLTCCLSATAATTVRVGFYTLQGFQEIKPDGTYSGYAYDYFQEIANIAGWQLEFVPVASWKQALDLLMQGEIDIVAGAQRSNIRESHLLFSEQPLIKSTSGICVRANDSRFSTNNLQALRGKKLATLSGARHNAYLMELLQRNDLDIDLIFYPSSADTSAALRKGEADAMVFTKMALPSDMAVIHNFPVAYNYFAVGRGEQKLLNELNRAMEKIQNFDQQFSVRLFRKYFGLAPRAREAFSETEREYIATREPITVIYNKNNTPLEFNDPKTGEFSGIVAEIFKRISQNTGLKFTFIPSSSFNESLRRVNSGEASLFSCIYRSHAHAEKYNLRLTSSAIFSQAILISNNIKPATEYTYALTRDQVLAQELIGWYAKKNITYYDTVKDCLNALLKGDADATIADLYIATYLLKLPEYHQLTSTMVNNWFSSFAIGISDQESPLLLSILNKGLQGISSEEIASLCMTYGLQQPPLTLSIFIKQHPTVFIIASAIFLIFLTVIMCYIFHQKMASVRRVEQLYYQDPVLKNHGNYYQFMRVAPKLLAQNLSVDYSLLYADINEFKFINDYYGYETGDSILKLVADVLSTQLSEQETFARIHADHFVLLLAHKNKQELAERVDKLVTALDKSMTLCECNMTVLFRIGICTLEKGTITNAHLQHYVNKAHYAKQTLPSQHKTLVAYYDHSIMEHLLEDKNMEQHMHQALNSREFLPYIQPKVDIETGAIVGAELLVRWRHKDRIISPGRFIPLFERNGFIPALDMYMYENLCRIQQQRIQSGGELFPISCNISYTLFIQEDFPTRVQRIAEQYNVPPHLLELELTETMIATNPDLVQQQLVRLHKVGFPIAMDDFGAGYSSITLLQNVHVDVIKLDKKFVQKGLEGTLERDLVQFFVQVAHNNNIQIVCEGIETETQAEFIRRLGCRIAQGFLYYRPMPEEEFINIMDNKNSVNPDL